MRAVQINNYGGTEVLEVVENVVRPLPGPGQVLVEVYSAGLNPVDWKIRAGFLKQMAPLKFPVTLGGDFAGVILAVGEGVGNHRPGEEVYGQAPVLNGGSGSFAEYVVANVANLARKPVNVDFAQAGALPLAGVSALQALEDHLKLKNGEKILIQGGAGGIGHLAVQLAKGLGAYVATTVGADDVEFVKSLGADQVINYQSQSFEEILTNFDAVFDTVGGQVLEKSAPVLKRGGRLVSMLGKPSAEAIEKFGIEAIGQGTKTDSSQLERLAKWVEAGQVKVHVAKVFPLVQVREAFDLLEKGQARGKVVLKIKND